MRCVGTMKHFSEIGNFFEGGQRRKSFKINSDLSNCPLLETDSRLILFLNARIASTRTKQHRKLSKMEVTGWGRSRERLSRTSIRCREGGLWGLSSCCDCCTASGASFRRGGWARAAKHPLEGEYFQCRCCCQRRRSCDCRKSLRVHASLGGWCWLSAAIPFPGRPQTPPSDSGCCWGCRWRLSRTSRRGPFRLPSVRPSCTPTRSSSAHLRWVWEFESSRWRWAPWCSRSRGSWSGRCQRCWCWRCCPPAASSETRSCFDMTKLKSQQEEEEALS